MNGLEAVASAIMWHEGPYKPPARSFRNCNPGNLKTPSHSTHDVDGFDVYTTFGQGWSALLNDLDDKFTGRNTHGLGATSTLADLFKVYAPAEDANDPASYAAFVAGWTQATLGRAITPQSTLGAIWTPN